MSNLKFGELQLASLTKHEAATLFALAGLLSNGGSTTEHTAALAIRYADAVIEQLAKRAVP
jgi:hypothetical protein